MQRFENILLLHDRASRGRKALRRATELARRNGARLKIVEVVDAPTGPQRTMQTTSGEVDLVEVITRDRLAALDRRAEAIAAEGVEVSTRVLYGSPFLAVIKEVLQGAHDLVMLTTEGDLNPPRGRKLAWGTGLGVLSTPLTLMGEVDVFKSVMVSGVLPYSLIMLLQVVALLRALRQRKGAP